MSSRLTQFINAAKHAPRDIRSGLRHDHEDTFAETIVGSLGAAGTLLCVTGGSQLVRSFNSNAIVEKFFDNPDPSFLNWMSQSETISSHPLSITSILSGLYCIGLVLEKCRRSGRDLRLGNNPDISETLR